MAYSPLFPCVFPLHSERKIMNSTYLYRDDQKKKNIAWVDFICGLYLATGLTFFTHHVIMCLFIHIVQPLHNVLLDEAICVSLWFLALLYSHIWFCMCLWEQRQRFTNYYVFQETRQIDKSLSNEHVKDITVFTLKKLRSVCLWRFNKNWTIIKRVWTIIKKVGEGKGTCYAIYVA